MAVKTIEKDEQYIAPNLIALIRVTEDIQRYGLAKEALYRNFPWNLLQTEDGLSQKLCFLLNQEMG
ncbi:MAG: hypothetical protein WBZ48_03775 [Bacteroidota bacterium]